MKVSRFGLLFGLAAIAMTASAMSDEEMAELVAEEK